jgi:hypothetical protein
MAHKDKLENKLEELGRAVGCDDSIVDTVMSRIEARTFGESKRVKNEFLVRKIIMNRFTKLAAAASIIVAIFFGIKFFAFDGTAVVYAITDAPEVLKKADIIHIKMQSYPEDVNCGNGRKISLSPSTYEFWYDMEKGWSRAKSIGHYVDSYNCTYEERPSERVFDGQYLLEIDHDTKEVKYFLLSPFCRQLNTHNFLKEINFYLFGDLSQLKNTIIIDQQNINGQEYDIWQGEIINHKTGMKEIWKYWIRPDTGELGRIQTWSPEDNGLWRLSSEVMEIEYDMNISSDMFETVPPVDYTMVNIKETATVRQLEYQSNLLRAESATCNGEFWIWASRKIGFTLEDGSVILGWSSASSNQGVPQGDVFKVLAPGGPLPELPWEISNITAICFDGEVKYTGRHLAYTSKNNEFFEWGIYVPISKQPESSEVVRYCIPYHLNVKVPRPEDYNCPEFEMVDLGDLESKEDFMSDDIPVESVEDFNKWILGAMAELSENGKAPENITYERVLRLAEQIRESLVE